MSVSGATYNAAYDIWLDPTPKKDGVNQMEIMIWFNRQGSIQPIGSPGQITSAWNATAAQGGSAVTARNVSYNGTLSPGGSTSFGYQATLSGAYSSPTSFTLNGVTCGRA